MPLPKLFSLLLPLLFLLLALSPRSRADAEHFESWCRRHGKAYATEEELLARHRIFDENSAFVEAHNAVGNSSYELALNAFADLAPHEFRAARLGVLAARSADYPRTLFRGFSAGDGDLPDSVDWRKKGAVTHVKDQASCGACWAFSATGAIEGVNKIVTGSLVSLSEQELVDCDRAGNIGCGGGLMNSAFHWVIKNHGIHTEDDYPYKAGAGSCLKDKINRRVVTIDGYAGVPANNEKLLLQAVAMQPVSVGICGSERAFQLYSKGIFDGPCSTSLDHAVLIVGYGSENGVDYWILKNSWGTYWGMDGYMYLARGSGNPQGICGINMLASYPTKTSPNPPPSPGPGPTTCSFWSYCPVGNTCCCTWSILGFCLSWSCCDLESAVCCKDNLYCCPHDYPICDSNRKQCSKGNGNSTKVTGIERKRSFVMAGSWNALLEAWEP